MEKERDLAANHVKSYGFKREISADNNMWLTHSSHLKVKKKNSGSLQTGKKHTKIVRPGNGSFNWELPPNPGDLLVMIIYL